MAFSRNKSLVVRVVSLEPFSLDDFPVDAEITGKGFGKTSYGRIYAQDFAAGAATWRHFPYVSKQGTETARAGKRKWRSGRGISRIFVGSGIALCRKQSDDSAPTLIGGEAAVWLRSNRA